MWVAMAAVAIVVAVVAAPRFKDREPSRTAVTTQTGTLTLESTPPGSTVLVDGAERGTTPLTIEVAPGTHSVQFRYRKNVRSVGVAVTAGEPTTQSVDWTRKPRPRPEAKEPTPAAAAPLDEPKAEEPAAADAPQPPLGN
jgi:PEGA domain